MKKHSRSILLSAAILSAAAGSAMGAGIPVNNGDLVIGFYQVDANGTLGSRTYIYNLGPAYKYRENTQKDVSISAVNTDINPADTNIAADLTEVFGADWANDPTVYWCVVGTFGQGTAGTVQGDNQGTSYISRPLTATYSASGPGSEQALVSGNNRNILRNEIYEGFFLKNSNVGTTGTSTRGAIIPITIENNLTTYFNGGAQFGINQEVRQPFAPGVVPGTVEAEGVLDIWRMVNSVTESGMDLTSGASTGNAALGRGQYCGSISIDASGELKVGATPEAAAGGYASFAAENGLGAATDDTDKDGVKDLIEYALATNLTGPDAGLGALSGTSFSFTKRAVAVANGDLTYEIEESDDLGATDPWQVVAPSTNTTEQITYTLPAGKGKVFARLKVTQAQ